MAEFWTTLAVFQTVLANFRTTIAVFRDPFGGDIPDHFSCIVGHTMVGVRVGVDSDLRHRAETFKALPKALFEYRIYGNRAIARDQKSQIPKSQNPKASSWKD